MFMKKLIIIIDVIIFDKIITYTDNGKKISDTFFGFLSSLVYS